MQKKFKQLADKIITREDLNSILSELKQVSKQVFENKKMQEIENQDLKQWLNSQELPNNSEQKHDFLKELENYLQNIRETKIEIARPVSYNFLKKISSLLEKQTGEKIILHISLNPNIVGGATIEYQGQYRNYSLAKEIDSLEI